MGMLEFKKSLSMRFCERVTPIPIEMRTFKALYHWLVTFRNANHIVNVNYTQLSFIYEAATTLRSGTTQIFYTNNVLECLAHNVQVMPITNFFIYTSFEFG